ncbi:hypothetical protein FHR84_000627 [Actinopolyspora biskrensis]|uniref:Uncharacterized protein n=1 Tax=Actinopolyspora biskrensis TaxID=1470178 RepID=A0A852Z4Y6_9ACTN|nr:hypothetical protein [Actinopolyspora biskrensis]NYH77313.1 hypothetical protein [Actinopolyspora biskrensis]
MTSPPLPFHLAAAVVHTLLGQSRKPPGERPDAIRRAAGNEPKAT